MRHDNIMSLFCDKFESFTGELKVGEKMKTEIVYKIKPNVEIFVAVLQSFLIVLIPMNRLMATLTILLWYVCLFYMNSVNVPFWAECFVRTCKHGDRLHAISNIITIVTILSEKFFDNKFVSLIKLFWFAQMSYHSIVLADRKSWIGSSIGGHALTAYRLCQVEWSKVNPVFITMLVFATVHEIIYQHKYYKNKGMSVDHTGHIYGFICGFIAYMIDF